MICTHCGENLIETGIEEYVTIVGRAEISYNPDIDAWQFTGESDVHWDTDEHLYYACGFCLGTLTEEQEHAISLG